MIWIKKWFCYLTNCVFWLSSYLLKNIDILTENMQKKNTGLFESPQVWSIWHRFRETCYREPSSDVMIGRQITDLPENIWSPSYRQHSQTASSASPTGSLHVANLDILGNNSDPGCLLIAPLWSGTLWWSGDKQHISGLMNLQGSVSHMPVFLIFSQNTPSS